MSYKAEHDKKFKHKNDILFIYIVKQYIIKKNKKYKNMYESTLCLF